MSANKGFDLMHAHSSKSGPMPMAAAQCGQDPITAALCAVKLIHAWTYGPTNGPAAPW